MKIRRCYVMIAALCAALLLWQLLSLATRTREELLLPPTLSSSTAQTAEKSTEDVKAMREWCRTHPDENLLHADATARPSQRAW